jgi:hypothetical protein
MADKRAKILKPGYDSQNRTGQSGQPIFKIFDKIEEFSVPLYGFCYLEPMQILVFICR